LDDPQFSDIKAPLTNTINDLADEHIISPEEEFRNNIEQVTKNIFYDPLYDFDAEQKTTDAQNIFLFRTKFEEIKKENKKNIKEEQTNQKEEQTNQKEEQTNQKEEQTNQKEEYINQLRKNLDKQYLTIEPQYKHKNQEELNTFKNQAKFQEILQKLPEEKHELYFGYRFAAEKIVEEARQSENKTISVDHYNFIQQFNTLDQELDLNSKIDISDLKIERQESKRVKTMNDIITNDKIGEELVARNKSMEKFVTGESNNIEIENKETIFPLQTIKTKVTERYADTIENTLNDLLKNNNLSQYKDQFNTDGSIKDINTIAESDRENIQTISKKIDKEITTIAQKEQNRLFQETNEVMKTKAVETLVKNIGQYFQVQSFDKKNLAEHVSIDIENGIHLDKNMLTLSANMDGRDIGFYYNIHNGEVRADDFVHLDGENNTKEDGVFYINRDQDKK